MAGKLKTAPVDEPLTRAEIDAFNHHAGPHRTVEYTFRRAKRARGVTTAPLCCVRARILAKSDL